MESLPRRRLLSVPVSNSSPLDKSLSVTFASAILAVVAYLLLVSIHRCFLCCRQRRNHKDGPVGPTELPDIPVTLYAAPSNDTTCSVCLSDFEEGEEVRVLPRCKHAFHRECIDRWLVRSALLLCPVCRARVADTAAAVGEMGCGSGEGTRMVSVGVVSLGSRQFADI